MTNDVFILATALFMVTKGATLATVYAARLAESFRLSKYTVGFIIVAVISILPETLIAINAALEGIPAFGLGMLLGSNIADLTLVFALIILLAGRGLKIESVILKNRGVYSLLMFLPLVLGWDGHFSRLEGLSLIIAGAAFYYVALKNGINGAARTVPASGRLRYSFLLLFSLGLLLVGSHFTVTAATALAAAWGVRPILIGMLIVGLGTTLPELLFSLKSVRKRDDSLAVGDILGTVLVDATVVIGILALVQPFSFPQKIIYLTGVCMVAASFVLFSFMHSKRTLSKKEAYFLFLLWAAFAILEVLANT